MEVKGNVSNGVKKRNGSSEQQAGVVGTRGCLVEEVTRRLVTGYHSAASGCALCLIRDHRGLGGVLAPEDLQTANRPELSLCGLCSLPLGVVALSLLLVLFSSELHYFLWYF